MGDAAGAGVPASDRDRLDDLAVEDAGMAWSGWFVFGDQT
jgi:hypothetical protein